MGGGCANSKPFPFVTPDVNDDVCMGTRLSTEFRNSSILNIETED